MMLLSLINKETAEDQLAHLEQLQRQCFSSPWSVAALQTQLEHSRGINLQLVVDDQLVGWLFYQWLFEDAEILQIAIDPLYQQRGFAKHLLIKSLPFLREKKIQKVMLEVRESNIGAIKLYQSLGFSLEGRRKRYYPAVLATGPREDALLYRLQLID